MIAKNLVKFSKYLFQVQKQMLNAFEQFYDAITVSLDIESDEND
jgi:hypothetical protein